MTGRHSEPPRTVRLLGQELDAVTLDEAVDQVVALVGQGGSSSP
jgi:hypothetical protein